MNCKIVSPLIVVLLFLLNSVAISGESGFYMSIDVNKSRIKKLKYFDFKVESGGNYVEIDIKIKDSNIKGLNKIVFEKRRKGDQALLISIPVKCMKVKDLYTAHIVILKPELEGVKFLLYFNKEGVIEELKEWYPDKDIPGNCFGICYIINPTDLEQQKK